MRVGGLLVICLLLISVLQFAGGSLNKTFPHSVSYKSYKNADLLNISTRMMLTADLDSDNVSDEIFVSPSSRLIIINYSSSGLIYLDEGNGIEIPMYVCVGDVDADGYKELIVGNHNASSIASLPNGIKDKILIFKLPIYPNSQPEFIIPVQSFDQKGKPASVESILIGNFSADGYDLAVNVYVEGDKGRIEIYDGPVYPGISATEIIQTSKGNRFIKLYDDNNDGLEDIYTLCTIDKKVEVYYKTQDSISNAPNKVYNTQNSPLSYSVKNRTLAILSNTQLRIYRNLNIPVDYSIGGVWIEIGDFNKDKYDEIGIIGWINNVFSLSYYDLNLNLISRSYLDMNFNFFHYSNGKIYLCGSSATMVMHYRNTKNFVAMAELEFKSINNPIGINIDYGKYYIWNSSKIVLLGKNSREEYNISNPKAIVILNNTTFCVLSNNTLNIVNRNLQNITTIFVGNNSSYICKINYQNYDVAVSHYNGNITIVDIDNMSMSKIHTPPASYISFVENIICGINKNYIWFINLSSTTLNTYPIKNMRKVLAEYIGGKYYIFTSNSTSLHSFEIFNDTLIHLKYLNTTNLKDFVIGDFTDDSIPDIILLHPSIISVVDWGNFSFEREYRAVHNTTFLAIGDLNFNGRLCISVISNYSTFSIVQTWEFENLPPVAIITSQNNIVENTTIILDGSHSYDQYSDLNNLNYTWYLLNGTQWEILSYNVTTAFTPKTQGIYTIKLSVRDDEGLYGNATKNITVYDSSPQVNFYYSPQNNTEGEKVNFYAKCKSYDPIINYTWKIENRLLYGKNITYTFENNGTYVVNLTVRDSDGSINSTEKIIIIKDTSPIILSISYYPLEPVEGNSVLFNCTYYSYDNVTSIIWNFGDGTLGVGSNTSHTYLKNGTYKIIVSVEDSDGSITSSNFSILVKDSSPTVNIISKDKAKEDEILNFTVEIESVDSIKSIYWDFNYTNNFTVDSSGNITAWRFNKSGEYTIAVIVIDSDNSTVIKTKKIEIINVPPKAEFIITYQRGNFFKFDASPSTDTPSDLPLLNYTWSFGDGKVAYGKFVTHTYRDSGRYYVKLTVRDDDGASSTYGKYVYITVYNTNLFPYIVPIFIIIPLLLIWLFIGKGNIEDIYVIHKNGILLSHYSSKIKPSTDEDTVSAMLIAIMDFIKNTYKDESESLKSVELHGKKMLIDRLKDVFIVVSYRGRAGKMIRLKMRNTLEKIWEKFGNILENWDGDMEKVRGIGDIIKNIWKI